MKEWEEQEREGIPKGDRMHERDIEEEGNDREGKGWGIGIKTFFKFLGMKNIFKSYFSDSFEI
jgi:hypothetical protein